jgi:hypothetical protein
MWLSLGVVLCCFPGDCVLWYKTWPVLDYESRDEAIRIALVQGELLVELRHVTSFARIALLRCGSTFCIFKLSYSTAKGSAHREGIEGLVLNLSTLRRSERVKLINTLQEAAQTPVVPEN